MFFVINIAALVVNLFEGIVMESVRPTERGQSLALVALLIFSFAAILALVIDGGNYYVMRRAAQNAADAGALAGALVMCSHQDAEQGAAAATEYAIQRNGATSATANADYAAMTMRVTATMTQNTIFAGLIGIPQVSPSAVAEAKCMPPSAGFGVLPVAWSCREKAGELPGKSCAQQFGPCSTADDPNGFACLYVVMDTVKVVGNTELQNDLVCDDPTDGSISPGTIDCDFDNDGLNELMAGGDRSWLDLNGGGGGAAELKDWVSGGFVGPLYTHTWLPEESGAVASIFSEAEWMVNKNVILPVFNKVCNGTPTVPDPLPASESAEQCEMWPNDTIISGGGTSTLYFQVISFAQFHVTCVQSKPGSHCPGHDLAVSLGSIDNNDRSIEGYFITDSLYGYGDPHGTIDVGSFVVNLVR
jgi:hypothetical protein